MRTMSGWECVLASLCAVLLLCPRAAYTEEAIRPAERIPLFDAGKPIETQGLYTWLKSSRREDPDKVFRVADGELHVTGQGLGGIITERSYRDYHMVLEFRWGTQQWGSWRGKAKDSGLMIHGSGKDGAAMGAWPASIQSQMREGEMGALILNSADPAYRLTVLTDEIVCENVNAVCHGNAVRWLNERDKPGERDRSAIRILVDRKLRVYTPETKRDWWDYVHPHTFYDLDYWPRQLHDMNPYYEDVAGVGARNTLDNADGQWNQMVVISDGDKIEVHYNGVKVNEATEVHPTSGKITLQSEYSEFFVRRWELWPVGAAPAIEDPVP